MQLSPSELDNASLPDFIVISNGVCNNGQSEGAMDKHALVQYTKKPKAARRTLSKHLAKKISQQRTKNSTVARFIAKNRVEEATERVMVKKETKKAAAERAELFAETNEESIGEKARRLTIVTRESKASSTATTRDLIVARATAIVKAAAEKAADEVLAEQINAVVRAAANVRWIAERAAAAEEKLALEEKPVLEEKVSLEEKLVLDEKVALEEKLALEEKPALEEKVALEEKLALEERPALEKLEESLLEGKPAFEAVLREEKPFPEKPANLERAVEQAGVVGSVVGSVVGTAAATADKIDVTIGRVAANDAAMTTLVGKRDMKGLDKALRNPRKRTTTGNLGKIEKDKESGKERSLGRDCTKARGERRRDRPASHSRHRAQDRSRDRDLRSRKRSRNSRSRERSRNGRSRDRSRCRRSGDWDGGSKGWNKDRCRGGKDESWERHRGRSSEKRGTKIEAARREARFEVKVESIGAVSRVEAWSTGVTKVEMEMEVEAAGMEVTIGA